VKGSYKLALLTLLVGLALSSGLVIPSQRASASIDLTGTWSVVLYGDLGGTAGLKCTGVFIQSGSDLTGTIDCTPPVGEPPPLIFYVVGSFDKGSRTFSTTILQNGSFTGSVSETGNCMSGEWTLLPGTPYTLEGTFTGTRGACSYTPTPAPTRTPAPTATPTPAPTVVPPAVGGISFDAEAGSSASPNRAPAALFGALALVILASAGTLLFGTLWALRRAIR
jgi:hypothetical protein